MNTINKLPLMAFVLGLGLMLSVMTMSSFKGNRATPNYGKYTGPGSVNGWIDLSTIPGENQPGGYTCESGGEICKAFFNSAPTSPDQEPDSDIVPGTFSR